MIVILVGNQKDREQYREVTPKQAEEFRVKHNIHFFIETSAKTGENVQDIFTMAAKMLYNNYKDKINEMVSSFWSYLFLRKKQQRRKRSYVKNRGLMAFAEVDAAADNQNKFNAKI